MGWFLDYINDKMDHDADYYEKVIRPRYTERVRCILGLFPEFSAEDLQKIKFDIEWANAQELRKKLNTMLKAKQGQ